MVTKYNQNSIKSLTDVQAVRERVQMLAGDSDMSSGGAQCIIEIISNAVDEFLAGYGKEIKVFIYDDGYFCISDNGRGVPFGEREDGTDSLIAVYTSLYSGGKYDKNSYKLSAGINGIGASLAALSAEKFEVQSIRDEKIAILHLEKGKQTSYNIIPNTEKIPNGTLVNFKPDKEVFDIGPDFVPPEKIIEFCERICYLNKGLKIKIWNQYKEEDLVFFSKNGIIDLVKKEKNLITSPIYYKVEGKDDNLEIAFAWSSNREEKSLVFSNGLFHSQGGTPLTGAKTAITKTFNNLTNENFSGEIIRSGLIYIINCSVLNPSYANQTKDKINNENLRKLASTAFSEALNKFYKENQSDFNKVYTLIGKTNKAEVAATKARETILNATKEITAVGTKKGIKIEKLKDSRNLGKDSILMLCEGDSAIGALVQARDVNSVGLLALRGKIISPFKNKEEDILSSDEVKNIMGAAGLVPYQYKSSKLRYGKVGILTDADPDGYSIAVLIIGLFWKFFPDFIKEKRLYYIKTPRYILGKKYIYDEKTELKGASLIKGIGEIDPDVCADAIFGENKVWIPIVYDNDFEKTLELLLGKEVEPRIKWIMESWND